MSVIETPAPRVGQVRDEWLDHAAVPTTRAAYARDFAVFETWCADHDVKPLEATHAHIDRYRLHLIRRKLSNATVCRHLSSLSSFYRFGLVRYGSFVVRNPASDLHRPKVSSKSLTPHLDGEELRALLRAAEASSARDAAIVSLLFHSALRVSEMCRAKVSDMRTEEGRRKLRVIRKGGEPVLVGLGAPGVAALDQWLEGRKKGYVFPDERREHIQPYQVTYRLKVLCADAGIDNGLTPHGLRHTAATLARQRGADMSVIKEMLGHRFMTTTDRYVQTDESIAAMALLDTLGGEQ